MSERGFSLIEALVAIAIMTTGIAFFGQVVTLSGNAVQSARASSAAALIARQKVEQWRAAGGSPPPGGGDTLASNTPGYCDFLDERGQPVSGGSSFTGSRFVRRWSIRPLSGAGSDLMVVEVLAFPENRRVSSLQAAMRARQQNQAHVVTIMRRIRAS
jgi:prepilin-type N-terminal cleavage/methylation domain-containing protein